MAKAPPPTLRKMETRIRTTIKCAWRKYKIIEEQLFLRRSLATTIKHKTLFQKLCQNLKQVSWRYTRKLKILLCLELYQRRIWISSLMQWTQRLTNLARALSKREILETCFTSLTLASLLASNWSTGSKKWSKNTLRVMCSVSLHYFTMLQEQPLSMLTPSVHYLHLIEIHSITLLKIQLKRKGLPMRSSFRLYLFSKKWTHMNVPN